ncbi:hypothetical protein ACJIZ3_013346 [Penstemon smallii]|uniref:MADS-box domain-containing protein n=1 Tax=Penstemon smallii TaxID=265156 RepID=A0ABD3UPK0_9LAMI
MGRRKIPIEKIKKKTSLQVTFTKRRMGLFKKASELCVLCGSEIAILVQSPADKIFSFGNPSVDYVINRFQTGATSSSLPNSRTTTTNENSRIKYAEAALKLEGEIAKKNKIIKEKETGEKLWWEEPYIENMELHELEEFSQALEHLKSNVLNRADDMKNLKMASSCNWASTSSNNFLPMTDNDEIKYHNTPMQIQCHGGDFNTVSLEFIF